MTNEGRTSRIGRLIDWYSLLGMVAKLEAQWRNDAGEPQERLEVLTTNFNTAIVSPRSSACEPSQLTTAPPSPLSGTT